MIRFYNIAKANDYNSKIAHEGITRTTVDEKNRATGQVDNH